MARLIYTLLLFLAAPLVPCYLLWRARRQPEYLQHWAERLGFYGAKPDTSQSQYAGTLWLHAVSVGETRATLPLIQRIRSRWPHHRILITHMTPTGRQTSLEMYGNTDAETPVLQAYLPYDFPSAMQRFLRHFSPQIGIIMETELWPNLVAACHERNIPVLLVNARLSEKSARGYRRFQTLTQQTLARLSVIAAQTADDAARFKMLGAHRVEVTGNMKFDISPPAALLEQGRAWRHRWRTTEGNPRRVLLAASTREGEEEQILEAYRRHLRPDLLLIIVPRHPQRFDAVADQTRALNLRIERRSQNQTLDIEPDTQVLLGDSMGELFAYYAASDVAFIGGSLLDYGCQNLIEACAVGTPVLIGPSTYNFAEAAQAALQWGAAQQIHHAEDIFIKAQQIMQSPGHETLPPVSTGKGKDFAAHHRGASERTIALLAEVMES